jgi:hypothetical protein
MLIAVDVDSTLYDADPLFSRIAKEKGIDYPDRAHQWHTYEAIKMFDGSMCDRDLLQEVFMEAHDYKNIRNQTPYDNAAKTLKSICKTYDKIDLAFVSDRHELSRDFLVEWLENNNFIFQEDIKVITTKDKRHWLRVQKPEIVIDDRVRTILMARYELNASVFAYRHNHNANLQNEADGIYICEDWYVIEKELKELLTRKVI